MSSDCSIFLYKFLLYFKINWFNLEKKAFCALLNILSFKKSLHDVCATLCTHEHLTADTLFLQYYLLDKLNTLSDTIVLQSECPLPGKIINTT